MIHTIEVAPHITLRCFSDDRFKQEGLSLTLVRPMCAEEASLNALLPAVLLRGSRSAPDLRAITQRLDDLYGASVGSQLRRVGDYQTTGLSCSFMKERFALEGDQVFDPMLRFLQELLFDPKLENGVFCADFVEGEKRNLLSAIASEKNDKRAYAHARELMMIRHAGLPDADEMSRIWPKGSERRKSHPDNFPPKRRKPKFKGNGRKPEQKWDKKIDE